MLDFAKSIMCNAKAIVTKVGNAYTEADRKRLYELAGKRNKTAAEWAEFDELNRREEQASKEMLKKLGKTKNSKCGNGALDWQIVTPKCKSAKYKMGQTVKVDGEQGTITQIQPMKLSDTPTYKIRMKSGKEIWRYEEEIGNSAVGNSSHTKEEAKTKDEYFKILKFYQTQGYKTNAGEYNPNGRIKLHKGDDSVEIVLVGNSMVGNKDEEYTGRYIIMGDDGRVLFRNEHQFISFSESESWAQKRIAEYQRGIDEIKKGLQEAKQAAKKFGLI